MCIWEGTELVKGTDQNVFEGPDLIHPDKLT